MVIDELGVTSAVGSVAALARTHLLVTFFACASHLKTILCFLSLFPFPFPILLHSLESLLFNSFTPLLSLYLSPPEPTQHVLSYYTCRQVFINDGVDME